MVETNSNHPLAQSLDSITERIELLKKIFPDVISEGQIDFNRLKAALGDSTAQTNERYELSWAGKSDARREIQKRTTATLRPDTANSVNWDATQNLYIEGENLEVLRTLQKAYFGKVKMIYIDPPYNTGGDSFVYPDDYSERLAEYRARTGQTDEAGFVNKQDMWKKNSKENGQFHSVWLSMMYPRLFLARNLLSEDGVIFVSIDDNEAADLKLLMDEVFGEENFVDCIIWKKRYGGGAKEKHLVSLHEYVFFYAKNISKLNEIFVPLEQSQIERYYKLKDEKFETRGPYRTHPLEAGKAMDERKNLVYPIKAPNGESIAPKKQWLWSEQRVLDAVSKNELEFVRAKDGGWSIHTKQYLRDEDGSLREAKVFSIIDDVYSQHGTNEIIDIFGNAKIFNYPKPIGFVRKLLDVGIKNDDIFMDFFSGSGSTAQAVLEMNEEDGGNRQFICVQMPEILDADSEAFKAGYKTIADIGRARIQKVIIRMKAKRLEESKQGKLDDEKPKQLFGFNAFKLAPSNFKEWRTDIENEEDLLAQMEYHLDSTKPDSLPQSMVYELLLKLSLPITTPIVCHTIQDEQQVYVASPTDAKPVAMFFTDVSAKITAFILKTKPSKVVCLNKAFADSQALTNFSLQLKDADISFEVL
jgi:adenine-specific DNA-methyltransferase